MVLRFVAPKVVRLSIVFLVIVSKLFVVVGGCELRDAVLVSVWAAVLCTFSTVELG